MGRLFLLLLAITWLAACTSSPKEIRGRKVIGTKWINGALVYMVEENQTDKAAMAAAAEEARQAGQGVVFQPLK